MSELAIRIRERQFDLPTCQRRLRHLRSIAVRNLSVQIGSDISVLQTFFTLHLFENYKAFYTSDQIRGSLNPTWKSFNVSHLPISDLDAAKSSVIVRIWRMEEEKQKLVIQWTVDLFGLVYLGDTIQRDGGTHGANTLIFGLVDGYYGTPLGKEPMIHDVTKCVLKVDQAAVRESYCTNSLARIQTVLRAIKQTQKSVNKVRTKIEERLANSQVRADMKHNCEMSLLRVNQLRRDLEWRTTRLHVEKDSLETQQATSHQKDVALKTKFETLQKDKSRLHDKKRGYFDVREDLIKSGAQLVMRRKHLLSELALIYPITELKNGEYRICGVKLPNSEDFAGQDEIMIAVALGYTCHLVHMISTFLDVPLRYNMEHRGSRSRIHDHILHKLTTKDRDFPLYSKGKERFQFNYGVYLLNKNIGQMRYYCGLGTTDLRQTLPNLKTLLELRLGVKFESGSKLTVMPLHYIPVPPNLGGPQRLTSGPAQLHATRDQPALTHNKVPSDASSDIKFEQLLNEVKQRQTMSPDTGTPGTQSPGTESPGVQSPSILSPDDRENQDQIHQAKGQATVISKEPSEDMFKPCGDTFFDTGTGLNGPNDLDIEVGSEAAEEASGSGTRWQHRVAANQPTVGLLDDDELLNSSPPDTNAHNYTDDIEERTTHLQSTTSTFKLRKQTLDSPPSENDKDLVSDGSETTRNKVDANSKSVLTQKGKS